MTVTEYDEETFSDIAEAFGGEDAVREAVDRFDAAGDIPPEPEAPTDGPVRLPGGFRRYTGTSTPEEVTEAWVTELTGEAEEKIAKARAKRSSIPAIVDLILESGVEKLGEESPRPGELSNMLGGDREFLLLEISKATFGDDITYPGVTCPGCSETFEVTISKDSIPVRALDSIDSAQFEVTLRNGRRAVVSLPTGVDQKAAFDRERTNAEINTVVLSRTITKLIDKDGSETLVADDSALARKLGSADREKILKEINDRSCGPNFLDIEFSHEPGCGRMIKWSIGLMELFRGM